MEASKKSEDVKKKLTIELEGDALAAALTLRANYEAESGIPTSLTHVIREAVLEAAEKLKSLR